MRAKNVYENIGFERKRDPIESMGIGQVSRRDFGSEDEVLDWIYKFPTVYTEGRIKKFTPESLIKKKYISDKDVVEDNYYTQIRGISGIDLVKWIKGNLTINNEDINLMHAKNLYDRLKDLLKDNFLYQ